MPTYLRSAAEPVLIYSSEALNFQTQTKANRACVFKKNAAFKKYARFFLIKGYSDKKPNII